MSISVYPEHDRLRSLLIQHAQGRPDMLPASRALIDLAQQRAHELSMDSQLVTACALAHELGKYLTAGPPEPRRLALCDLPASIMASRARERWPELVIDHIPAQIVALLAWCELRTTPDGKSVTLRQRKLYMERHYASDHPQVTAWNALLPLAERVESGQILA
jgi:hypothetical protein